MVLAWNFDQNSIKEDIRKPNTKQFYVLHIKYPFIFLKQETELTDLNPLNANPAKWSNTLKQFVGCCRRIVRVCLAIL